MDKMLKHISMLKIFTKKNIRNLIDCRHTLLLADTPFHDDLYLVAYPKSGVTWFSFLLANLSLQLSGDSRKATFFNLQMFVPDIHVSNKLNVPLLSQPGHRIIKSHSPYNKNYKNVFYLLRDPRKVMVSYPIYFVWLMIHFLFSQVWSLL